MAVVCLSCLVIVLGGALFDVLYKDSQEQRAGTTSISTFSPSTSTQKTDSKPTYAPTMRQVTPSGPSYVGDLYSQDFNTFLGGFIEAMNKADYSSVGGSTSGDFSMYCTSYFKPDCQYNWISTYTMLHQENLHFQFNYPIHSYNGDSGCKAAYVNADTYINVTFTQDGSIYGTGQNSGNAVFVFGNEEIGYNISQWFWDGVVLNASC